MMNKRILLAGMAAALSVSAAGIPAYAATTTQQNQSTIEQNSEKPSDDQKPTEGQPGRKSDEDAMKEGNPTPDLPDGVTTDDFDAPMERPDGDDMQTPPEKPDGDDTPRPAGDDTQTPPEKPADDDDGKGPQGGQQGTPGKKSDEDAMKEGNVAPDLPQGVTVDGSSDEA